MKVLVLHRRLSGYYIACLGRLKELGVEVQVVAWPNQSDAPFDEGVFQSLGQVRNREDFSQASLLEYATEAAPDVVLVAGWSDKGYVQTCKALKARGVPIVAGCDTQWKGSPRQYLAAAVAPQHVRRFIDVLWVSGERQRQLAVRLGYTGERCWDGIYACDWDRFSAVAEERWRRVDEGSGRSFPRTFAFLGRYAPEKGLDTLTEAYRIYARQVDDPWRLICAGKGAFREHLVAAGAEDRSFIQPQALPDFFAEADCFILPSRFEPWGVVVQEAAATGLPMIVSDASGAGVHLLRDRWNGRSFAAGDVEQLAECMVWVHRRSEENLAAMGRNSFELSKQYTPERWARTLVEGIEALGNGKFRTLGNSKPSSP